MMPREFTTGEVRQILIRLVWDMVRECETAPNAGSMRTRMERLAFSILTLLDQGALFADGVHVPGFVVAPNPPEGHKEYSIGRGFNWFPANDADRINADVAGGLHELFFKFRPETTPSPP